MLLPLPPVPPFPYRDPKNDRHEGPERIERQVEPFGEFVAGFVKTIVGVPCFVLLVLAGRRMELATWVTWIVFIAAIGGFVSWRLLAQRRNRHAAFTTGVVWGAAIAMVLFLVLARRVL